MLKTWFKADLPDFLYMGNTSTRQQTYEQYYEALKHSNPKAARSLDISGLNPYDVLGVRKNFEWDELKESYRRIAKVVHPDKGGSEKLFQMVTDCFRQLAHEYKLRTSDRPHHELKQDAQSYYRANPVSTKQPSDENFLDRFNRMFEENKIDDDENAGGYAHMMAPSSKTREDIQIQRILPKFSSDAFHKTFDEVTSKSLSKEVVVHHEPEALPLAKKIQYTELGGDKPGDFSSGEGGGEGRRALQYTDYMKAHTTTRLVDPRAVKEAPTYKSVEQYESARAKAMAKPATAEELAWRAQREAQEKEAEEARLRRLRDRDRLIASHHEKVNRLMLGGK